VISRFQLYSSLLHPSFPLYLEEIDTTRVQRKHGQELIGMVENEQEDLS
jgi:hypothetical protein